MGDCGFAEADRLKRGIISAMRRVVEIVLGRLIPIAIFTWVLSLLAFWLFAGDLYFLNPKWSRKNLIGLTSAQVIQRLGQPSDDPRVPHIFNSPPSVGKGWKNEKTDGPLYLSWDYQGDSCVIEFSNDKVVDVHKYRK